MDINKKEAKIFLCTFHNFQVNIAKRHNYNNSPQVIRR